MLNRSEVLKCNAFVIIRNWVCFNLWWEKTIINGIQNSLDHMLEEKSLIPDITISECKIYLQQLVKSYVDDIAKLKRDIEKERKTYVSPSAKNTKEFFIVNELPFETAEDYQKFLLDNVLYEF